MTQFNEPSLPVELPREEIAGPWQLPDGWEWRHLSMVAQDTERRNPKQDTPSEQFFYVDISSIDNEFGVIKNPKTILGEDAPSRARKVIKTEDVILATTRPYLRNIAQVPSELDNAICSTGFCVLRAKPDVILSKYIYYACRSELVIDQLIPKQRGASYPAVTDGDVFEVVIPLPYPNDPTRSLIEQSRIVNHIETLLEEVRDSRKIHQAIIDDTNRLMDAVLLEVFPNPETDDTPSGWIIDSVANISEKPQYGYTQSAKWNPVGPKFLRITDIQNGHVNWDNVPYCEADRDTLEKYRLKTGDIVFARSGATTGKTFFIENPPEAIFASYLIRLHIHQKALPEYIYWFFQSPYYWAQVKPRGAAQPNMNAQILGDLKVPIPEDKNVQLDMIAYFDKIQLEIKAMQEIQEQDEQALEQVEQAILAQAFRGEL